MGREVCCDVLVLAFVLAGPLLLARGDELIAALVQGGHRLTLRIGRRLRLGPQALSHGGEHARVDGIGLGKEARGSGEVAGPSRVDAREGDAGRYEHSGERSIIASGRLEQNEGFALAPGGELGHQGGRGIGETLTASKLGIEHVEMVLGNVDSDDARVYVHGAYPCAARSGDAASINCSGWVTGTRARTEPDNDLARIGGPTVSRPQPSWHRSNTQGASAKSGTSSVKHIELRKVIVLGPGLRSARASPSLHGLGTGALDWVGLEPRSAGRARSHGQCLRRVQWLP